MRPTKNKVYCYGCGRTKMLFESEQKALNFIRYWRCQRKRPRESIIVTFVAVIT